MKQDLVQTISKCIWTIKVPDTRFTKKWAFRDQYFNISP